jgi:hypothetical protein
MPISDYATTVPKQYVQITTVDTRTRVVQGRLKDGVIVPISMTNTPPFFRWPRENEVWSICYTTGGWILGEFAEQVDAQSPIESLLPGEARIDASRLVVPGNLDVSGYLKVKGSTVITEATLPDVDLSEVDAHIESTTAVHGIADTSKLLRTDAFGNGVFDAENRAPRIIRAESPGIDQPYGQLYTALNGSAVMEVGNAASGSMVFADGRVGSIALIGSVAAINFGFTTTDTALARDAAGSLTLNGSKVITASNIGTYAPAPDLTPYAPKASPTFTGTVTAGPINSGRHAATVALSAAAGNAPLVATNTGAGSNTLVRVFSGYAQDGTTETSFIGANGAFNGNGVASYDRTVRLDFIAGSRINLVGGHLWLSTAGMGILLNSPDGTKNKTLTLANDSTLNVPIGTIADSWTANNVAFAIKQPGGNNRTTFSNFGNLDINVNNANGGVGWGAVVPLTVNHDGTNTPTGDLATFSLAGARKAGITKAGQMDAQSYAVAGTALASTHLSDTTNLSRVGHTHAQSDITGLSTSLAAKADLVGGVVPSSQIPSIATNTTVTVASQAAMLALTTTQVQPGDIAIRTDQAGRRWLLSQTDPSVLANWIQLETPDSVTSVNGQQGIVVLGYADVGAAPTSHTHTIANVTGLQAALDGKASLVHTHAIADVTGLQGALDLKAPLANPALTGTATVGGQAIVVTNDARLSDQRVPTDSSVTDAKVATGAAIDPAKIAGTAVITTDTRLPTQTQKDALAGTSGAPGDANRYVTNNDPRIVSLSAGSQTSYVATIGDGVATTFNLDHNLNTRTLVVQVYESASPFGMVQALVTKPSLNRVTVTFENGYVPTTGEFQVVIMVPGSISSNIPVVTALPSSPTDGQTIDYLADATNGIVWRFKYRVASTSPYKWEFIGGAWIMQFVGQQSYRGASTSYGSINTVSPDAASPMTITLPLAGDYDFEIGAQMSMDQANAQGFISYTVGAAAANDGWGIGFRSSSTVSDFGATRSRRHLGLAAGTTLSVQGRSPNVAIMYSYDRTFKARPVRVG